MTDQDQAASLASVKAFASPQSIRLQFVRSPNCEHLFHASLSPHSVVLVASSEAGEAVTPLNQRERC